MSEWKDSEVHPDTYKYGGFFVNHEIKLSGNYKRHEMSCSNHEVNLKVVGESFKSAKKKIIQRIDSYNSQ